MVKRLIFNILLLLIVGSSFAKTYVGRVTDIKGVPIGYATVYPTDDVYLGTATNDDGVFSITTEENLQGKMVISFLGYEKKEVDMVHFSGDTLQITLQEQPIELDQMVVSAKPAKQKNKRKKIANLLYLVYNQMQKDFSKAPVRYEITSNARMDASGKPWGMEQMIASVVFMPEARRNNRDSIQFQAKQCKRFLQQTIREKADTILNRDFLAKGDRRFAIGVDSGILVHQSFFEVYP